VPAALARRIDRLARAVHRAHRYAHHPLCGMYAGELVRLGRRARVCRGCLLVASGAITGAALALACPIEHALRGLAAHAGLACVAASVFVALALIDAWRLDALTAAAARPRAPWRKLITRFAPAVVLAAAIAFGLRRGDLLGLAFAVTSAAVVAAVWIGYRRRGPDRGPCTRCPEGPPHAGCSGFAVIVQRERAFQRMSRRLLVLPR
jgi:hypothetical protein